ncbi:MAG TPA: O-linked GlcNAc transferase [Pseudobdellovibrionaceae bacterium]|nr:O-linked GlcNAc transferase [Pseudobdellovibrionaceae bacterium]
MTLELSRYSKSSLENTKNKIAHKYQGVSASVFIQNALLLDKNKETHLAINFLRASLAKYPKHYDLQKTLADLLEKTFNYEEARRLRFYVMNQNYHFESVYYYANNFYLQAKDSEALSYYFEALSIIKEESDLLFDVYKNIGNIQLKQGDFEGAEEFYNKAYVINSKSDALLVNLGTLEIQKNNFEKSDYCFKEALNLNRRNDKAWVGLAMIQSHKSDIELAWGNLRYALEINPRNKTALLLMSPWAFSLKRIPEFMSHLQNYLSIESFDLDFSKLLIHCFCELGQFHLAQIEIERAYLFYPKDQELSDIEKKIKDLL